MKSNCGIVTILVILLLLLSHNTSHFKLYKNNRLIDSDTVEPEEQKLLRKYVKPTDIILQLGGHIGTSCILTDKILNEENRSKSYCVDPNPHIIPTLKKNKELNNANFKIIPSFLTKKCNVKLIHSTRGKVADDVRQVESTTKSSNCMDLYQLEYISEITVLFADCEGCLCKFVDEYPDFIQQVRLIIYETDVKQVCNYNKLQNTFIKNGFRLVEDNKSGPGYVVFIKNI